MPGCSAIKCKNRTEDGLSLFLITKTRRTEWLKILGLPESTPLHSRICEVHFELDQVKVDKAGRITLKPGAVPSLFGSNLKQQLKQETVSTVTWSPITEDVWSCSEGTASIKYIGTQAVLRKHALKDATNLQESLPHSRSLPSLDVEKLATENKSLVGQNAFLLSENEKLRKEVEELQKSKALLLQSVSKILNREQLALLQRGSASSNSTEWSPDSMKMAIRIRLVVRARAYEILRQENEWPLPALRTINRRLIAINLVPGEVKEMVLRLRVKLRAEKVPASGWLAVLSFDEMAVEPKVEYDKGLKCFLGLVSRKIAANAEEAQTKATHCLAFLLRGLTVHWKQLITYLLTGNSVHAMKLWEFVEELIKFLSSLGFIVVCVSTDMGGGNQAMWSQIGVTWSRNGVYPSIPHPCPSEGVENLYFSPDVPHLLKNIWAQLLRSVFFLPTWWLDKHNLTSNIVASDHVREFVQVQGSQGIRPVPNLNIAALNPTQFEKMRVNVAKSFFSEKLGHAIITASDMGLISKAAKTTGCFILAVAEWYSIMSSRSCVTALDKNETGVNRAKFLENFVELISGISFWSLKKKCQDNSWKPIQGGVSMATKVTLALWSEHVLLGPLDFLLPSRLFTSACENLFTQVRGAGDIDPSPVKVRHQLRLISVAQYIRCSSKASYVDDDEAYYIDFLSSVPKNSHEDLAIIGDEEIDDFLAFSEQEISEIAKQGLYYVSGWVISRLKGSCSVCTRHISSPAPLPGLPFQFTNAVTKVKLCHPTELSWKIITTVEDIVIARGKEILLLVNPKAMIFACMNKVFIYLSDLPECHNVVEKVAGKYLDLRLHVLAKDVSFTLVKPLVWSSTSSYMRSAVENTRPQIPHKDSAPAPKIASSSKKCYTFKRLTM